MEINWKELVGKRVLVRYWVDRGACEIKVLELSPSAEWVKVKGMGVPRWERTENITVVEVLEQAETPPPGVRDIEEVYGR